MENTATAPETAKRSAPRRVWIATACVSAFVLLSGVVGWAAVDGFRNESAESVAGPETASRSASEGAPGSLGTDATGASEQGVAAEASPDMVPPETTLPQVVVQGDKVVRSASLTVTVEDDLGSAITTARGVVTAAGGFVASMERTSTDDSATAFLTLRVPANNFEAAISQLEGLGDVTSSTQATQDVTQQSIDIDARLRSLTAEAEALRALLARAGSTAEILEIRRQLNDVTTQIEVLTAQRQALDQQIAMSTISLSLLTPGAVVGPEPDGFWSEAFGEAWERLRDGVAAIVVGAASLLPFALLALAVFVAGRAVWRRRQTGPGPQSGVQAATGA